MKCSNCDKQVSILKQHPTDPDVGVCTICEITISRQFPGVNGVQHANEVDPSNPDPRKALDLMLKELTHNEGPNSLTDKEASMIQKVHARDFDRTDRHRVPDRTIAAQRERISDMTASDMDDHNKRVKVLEHGLGKAQGFFESAKAKAGKGAPNVVVDIPL